MKPIDAKSDIVLEGINQHRQIFTQSFFVDLQINFSCLSLYHLSVNNYVRSPQSGSVDKGNTNTNLTGLNRFWFPCERPCERDLLL